MFASKYHENYCDNIPWTLHHWLSFYKLDFVKEYSLNFLPMSENKEIHFNTSEYNYETLIKKINVHIFLFEKLVVINHNPYEDHYLNMIILQFMVKFNF